MRLFNFKLLALVGLFAALVVKGGQLCSADGVQAMPRLAEKDRLAVVEPLPQRSIEEDFRGVSPLPSLAESAPARKVTKAPLGTRKVEKPQAIFKAKPAAEPKAPKVQAAAPAPQQPAKASAPAAKKAPKKS
jgi:hypothetical protein